MSRFLSKFGLYAWLLGIGCVLSFLVAGSAVIYLGTGTKYRPVDVDPPVVDEPAAIDSEVQTEPHTCGLHAVRTVYASYGLDPDNYDLRFRLGTDNKANILDKSSTGTLQPDILRVMRQDGFAAEPVDLKKDVESLRAHLQAGQLALVLTRPGSYHWVVLRMDSAQQLWVVDSLAAEPYPRRLDTLVRDELLSAILVQPSTEHDPSTGMAHKDGIKDMGQTLKRTKRLK